VAELRVVLVDASGRREAALSTDRAVAGFGVPALLVNGAITRPSDLGPEAVLEVPREIDMPTVERMHEWWTLVDGARRAGYRVREAAPRR
jgi:hypothetical protein